MTECMHACTQAGRASGRWGRGTGELSNIRMWSLSLPVKLALRKTSTPNGLSIIQAQNNPRLASSDKGEGIKEPKKKTDRDSIIEVLVILGIERKNVNTFNDSFAFDRP